MWFRFLAFTLGTPTKCLRASVSQALLGSLLAIVIASTHFLDSTASAQVTFSDLGTSRFTNAPQQPADKSNVEFNLDGEIQLGALLTYMSKRLGVRFEYSPQIASRSVVLRAPGAVPVDALPTLLSSVLRTESLVLIDADIAGWKRIVDVKDMAQFAPTGTAKEVLARQGVAAPVTQVFMLKNVSVTTLTTALSPFLSENGGNVLGLSDSNVLIITDYAANIAAVEKLIKIIDQPRARQELEVYEVRNLPAKQLAEQVSQVLSAERKDTASRVDIIASPKGNRILLAGELAEVQDVLKLLQKLDAPMGIVTKVYMLKHIPAERLDRIAKGFLGDGAEYESTVDEDGNLLVVRSTADVQQQVARLMEQIDTPIERDESPIQFYKLKNASAIDVLYSLLALQQATGIGASGVSQASYTGPLGGGAPSLGFSPGSGFPGAIGMGGNVAGNPLQTTRLPLNPGAGSNNRDSFLPATNNPLQTPSLADGTYGRANPAAGYGQSAGGGSSGFGGGAALGGVATLPGGARVSADIATNSLIVVAPKNVQEMYAELIRSLDQRRPQVLIEAKIIAVDTSDDFSLGVEVSAGDRVGETRLFKFTSFGLSEVNAETGALQIIPGLGFNGTLVDPNVADVVVRALSAHRRAKVLAAPKILVNDNSTGKLESVSSVPFASVNASQTVSTTSLGGDQQAGTIITVTPHINEDDHLNLDFDVEFSTFAGASADGLPPPRQIDRVGSSVTIPDGKTVVVGGLKRISDSDTFSGLPWAEKIPVIRELTSRTDRSQQTTSFFLFIRPIVLRDSRFADLRFLSDEHAGEFGLPGDYPTSFPELIP